MRRRSDLLLALGASVVILAPTRAEAFCRTRVDSAQARKDGDSPDGDGCYGTGAQLFWRSRCISYEVYGTPRTVAPDVISRVIADAFAKWTQTSCAVSEESGANPDARISIDVRDLGETQCWKAGKGDGGADQVGYTKGGPNQNAIAFRNDFWPYRKEGDSPDQESSTLGLTTVTYETSGEIVDADMELNTIDTPVKVTDIGPNDYDLASIITHEAGHFLGIAHSNDATATMYFEYARGETRKQFLKLDDIRAICDAYAPGGLRYSGDRQYDATECDPTPRGGIQRDCPADEGGCSMPSAQSTGSGNAWLPACALSVTALIVAGVRASRRTSRSDRTRNRS